MLYIPIALMHRSHVMTIGAKRNPTRWVP